MRYPCTGCASPSRAKGLVQADGEGVGLLARGTGGAPREETRPALGRAPLLHLRHELVAHEIEVGVLAEEKRVVGRDGIDEVCELLVGLAGLQQLAVLADAGAIRRAQAFAQPRSYHLALTRIETDAAALIDQLADEIELTFPHMVLAPCPSDQNPLNLGQLAKKNPRGPPPARQKFPAAPAIRQRDRSASGRKVYRPHLHWLPRRGPALARSVVIRGPT